MCCSVVDLAANRHTSLSLAHFVFCPSPVAVVTSRGNWSGGGEMRGKEQERRGGGGCVGFLGERTTVVHPPPPPLPLLFFYHHYHISPKPALLIDPSCNYSLSFGSFSSSTRCFFLILFCFSLFSFLPLHHHPQIFLGLSIPSTYRQTLPPFFPLDTTSPYNPRRCFYLANL